MAYELVRLAPPAPNNGGAEQLEDDGEWDLPPTDGAGRSRPQQPSNFGTARRRSRAMGAAVSDRDADTARAMGDNNYAVLRETDAAEQRQHGWGTGDARTWGWIAAMFFGFLLLVAFVYFMPHGTHNQNDGGNSGGSPTPAIRVY